MISESGTGVLGHKGAPFGLLFSMCTELQSFLGHHSSHPGEGKHRFRGSVLPTFQASAGLSTRH